MRPKLPFFAPCGGIVERKVDRDTFLVRTPTMIPGGVEVDTDTWFNGEWYVDFPHNVLLTDDEREAIRSEAVKTVEEYIDACITDR